MKVVRIALTEEDVDWIESFVVFLEEILDQFDEQSSKEDPDGAEAE